MRKIAVTFGIVLAILVTVVASAGFCLFCPWALKHHLTTVDIGQGHRVRIWSQEDWDHSLPTVYYDIQVGDQIVSPKSWLGSVRIDRGQTFQFSVTTTDDGQLAGVVAIDRATGEKCFVVLYDFANRKSLPRDRHDEPNEKWDESFQRLNKKDRRFPLQ